MRRHAFDPVSFLSGLVIAAAGWVLLAGRVDLLTQANWLAPALLIVIAVAMFASALWTVRRPDGGSDVGR
jgi:hypothetical protein